MPGLTIIVAGADPERLHAALSIAAANAALGQRSRIFLQGEAAGLLGNSVHADLDDVREREGIPTLAELLVEALAMEVEVIACQSGLALAGIAAEKLPAGVSTSGLVELLAGRGDDQLMIA